MPLSFETHASGRRTATKWASTEAELQRLRNEAEMLAAARHPGVVELEDVAFDDGSGVLRLTAIDGPSLAQSDSLAPAEIAGVAAAIAATLADLHLMGVVHGAIDADHVLLDSTGSPILCGFGQARPIEEADPSGDVNDLGHLLLALIEGRPRSAEIEVLRAVASWAVSPAPASRPSAAGVASALADRIPSARLPRPGTQSNPVVRSRPRRPAPSRVALGSGVAILLFLTGLVMTRPTPGLATSTAQPKSATHHRPAHSSGTTPSTVHPSARLVWPPLQRAGCPTATGAHRADLDGDGCQEAYSFQSGLLTSGQRQWRIGAAGDVVAVGQWSCQASATAVLLQPGPGDLWAFDGWASASAALTSRHLGSVSGARSLAVEDRDGDGCADLVVHRADGPPVTMPVKRSGA